MQIPATRVVTQSAPEREHRLFARLRERAHVCKAGDEALVVRDDRSDLGLLQHDFRKPDAVRVACPLPGEVVSPMAALPGDQLFRESHGVPFSQTMAAFILRRLGQAVLVMLAVGLIAFSLFRFVGDPVIFMLGQDATPEDRTRVTQLLGLDRPFYVQYAAFVNNALHGQFGLSLRQVRPVSTLIVERLPATLELSFMAALFALAAGIPMGVVTALRRNSWLSHVLLGVSLAGVSLPTFLIGILLIVLFSVQLGWLPSFGRGD